MVKYLKSILMILETLYWIQLNSTMVLARICRLIEITNCNAHLNSMHEWYLDFYMDSQIKKTCKNKKSKIAS